MHLSNQVQQHWASQEKLPMLISYDEKSAISPANWALHKSTLLIHSGDILSPSKMHLENQNSHHSLAWAQDITRCVFCDFEAWTPRTLSRYSSSTLMLLATHRQIKNTNADGWVRGCWINNTKASSSVGTHIVVEMSITMLFMTHFFHARSLIIASTWKRYGSV